MKQFNKTMRIAIVFMCFCMMLLEVSTGCASNQYLDSSNNSCVDCSSNCLTCKDDSSTCTSCGQSRYLNSSYCDDCYTGCTICTSMRPSSCTACLSDYKFVEGDGCNPAKNFKTELTVIIAAGSTIVGLFIISLILWLVIEYLKKKHIFDPNKLAGFAKVASGPAPQKEAHEGTSTLNGGQTKMNQILMEPPGANIDDSATKLSSGA